MEAKLAAAVLFSALTLISVLSEATENLEMYGNRVIKREKVLTSAGRRAWLDLNSALPKGKVTAFYFYVHDGLGNDLSPVRLQIWTPVNVNTNEYKLKWEKKVTLNDGDNTEYKFRDLSVLVNRGDLIGWTVERDISPISFDYIRNAKTLYFPIEGGKFPVNGETYTFSHINFPAVFSVAVIVETDADSTTQSTTTQSSDVEFYGNPVIQRKKWSEHQGKKSWMEPESTLPTGHMNTFLLFIHPNANPSDLGPVRLQVWSPVNITQNTYRLRWELRERLDMGVGRRYEFNVGNVRVERGDRIGWTVEADSGPISFDYSVEHFTYFRSIEDNKYPSVGGVYRFGGTHFPSIFSVGVTVTKDGYLKTTSPDKNKFKVDLVGRGPSIGVMSALILTPLVSSLLVKH